MLRYALRYSAGSGPAVSGLNGFESGPPAIG